MLQDVESIKHYIAASRLFYLLSGVAEDDRLCNGEVLVQVTECVKFPLLFLHVHIELLEAFQR